jgi:quinol monooxygenase YgiN
MSAKPLTLTVTFQARPGKEAELLGVLTGLLAPTRAEAGCINYDLHIAPDDPSKFLFYENWASKAHHEAHDKTCAPASMKSPSRRSRLSGKRSAEAVIYLGLMISKISGAIFFGFAEISNAAFSRVIAISTCARLAA